MKFKTRTSIKCSTDKDPEIFLFQLKLKVLSKSIFKIFANTAFYREMNFFHLVHWLIEFLNEAKCLQVQIWEQFPDMRG